MNRYEIEGQEYEAMNEYQAVKQAYKMAEWIAFGGYDENETWNYVAGFRSGHANVIVKRIA